MRIDLIVKYQCGCEDVVRTDVSLPPELANAKRTQETYRRIADYIIANYNIEKWRCPNGHGIGVPQNFAEIIGINN
jgi:hypothetical protein